MIFNKSKQRRQNERDFYAKTRDNQNAEIGRAHV